MRKEFDDFAERLGWQTREDILQIDEGIMVVEFRRLDQAHDRGHTLAGTQAAGKKPILPPGRNRANAVRKPPAKSSVN